jgi:hypothetical protein
VVRAYSSLGKRKSELVRARQTILAVGFAAMTNAANFDGTGIWAGEEEAVIAHAQAKFVSSLHSFYVTQARFCKTEEHGESFASRWACSGCGHHS